MTDGITEAMKGMENNKKMRVFLGGTCNESTWRDDLIPKLRIDYFNPVVEDWTPECQVEELKQREECDFLLYVLTPRMQGVYSIAEVVDDSNKRPGRTIFCYLEKDKKDENEVEAKKGSVMFAATSHLYFSPAQKKSMIAVGNLVERNGSYWFKTIEEIVLFLNKY